MEPELFMMVIMSAYMGLLKKNLSSTSPAFVTGENRVNPLHCFLA